MSELVTITIDGHEYQVPAGANLLQVCLDLGLMVPHFCYHEALGPAGSCRLCAAMIALAKDKPARLEMTCMTRVADGMVVTIQDPYAKDFRRGVIEYLMLNHPHDCPVCDEGGECMLQDMTVLSEHIHRRSRFPKRTWRNQYLGPLIHHEMNRCITCYRCVRFYRDYALGADLGAFGSRDRVYFGRVKDGVLESEFAGNLVDVCPTGVFTNKRFREVYSRPWDLQTARAVCVHCSVGCNVLPGGRHRSLRRTKPAPHKEINRFFICDRGRYGPEFVNYVPTSDLPQANGKDIGWEDALSDAAKSLKSIVDQHGPKSVLTIGAPSGSLELNAALVLLQQAVGATPQIVVADSDAEFDAIRFAARTVVSRRLPTPSLVQIEKCDAIVNLGGDLTAEAPMMDLSVRQAIRAGAKYFSVSPRREKLEDFAAGVLRVRPDAVASAAERIVAALENPQETIAPEIVELVQALRLAKRPLVLCSVVHGDAALSQAAERLASALHSARRPAYLAYYFPAANSCGIALVRHAIRPSTALSALESGEIKAVIVAENELLAFFGSVDRMKQLLGRCELVMTVESAPTTARQLATICFPALPHYLTQGRFVNYEGRVQYSDSLKLARPLARGAADVLVELIEKLGGSQILEAAKYSEIYEVSPDLDEQIENLSTASDGIHLVSARGECPSCQPREWPTWNGLVQWDIYHHFGSERLSCLSPPVAELAPPRALELHPEDARRLGLSEGQTVEISNDDGTRLPVVLNEHLALGTYALRRIWEGKLQERQREAQA